VGDAMVRSAKADILHDSRSQITRPRSSNDAL
jgi:hypothetical protein